MIFLSATVIGLLLLLWYRWVLMQHDLTWGRAFLFAVPLLSVVMPFLPWRIELPTGPGEGLAPVYYSIQLPGIEVAQQAASSSWLVALWLLGSLLVLLYFVWGMVHLFRQLNEQKPTKIGDRVMVIPGTFEAFTLFGTVYVSEDISEKSGVLAHELAHVSQRHYLDVTYMLIVIAVFWWHPLTWWYRRMYLQHLETMADRAVLDEGVSFEDYRDVLLAKTFTVQEMPLAQSFFNKNYSLKHRCIMMMKNNRQKPLMGLTAVLATAILLATVPSCNKAEQKQEKIVEIERDIDSDNPSEMKQETLPEFEGGHEGLVKYITDNVKYPVHLKESGEEAKVFVEFKVEGDGKVTGVNVKNANAVDPAFVAEAERVFADMPNWKPAETDEKREIAIELVLPIHFKLPEED